jgi:hypothetical protein
MRRQMDFASTPVIILVACVVAASILAAWLMISSLASTPPGDLTAAPAAQPAAVQPQATPITPPADSPEPPAPNSSASRDPFLSETPPPAGPPVSASQPEPPTSTTPSPDTESEPTKPPAGRDQQASQPQETAESEDQNQDTFVAPSVTAQQVGCWKSRPRGQADRPTFKVELEGGNGWRLSDEFIETLTADSKAGSTAAPFSEFTTGHFDRLDSSDEPELVFWLNEIPLQDDKGRVRVLDLGSDGVRAVCDASPPQEPECPTSMFGHCVPPPPALRSTHVSLHQ